VTASLSSGITKLMFLFTMFAATRLGAIFVPLNFRLTGPELAFMLEDCAARVLIVGAAHRAVIEPQLARLP
jgi:fatty-acyl-CoA synthase